MNLSALHNVSEGWSMDLPDREQVERLPAFAVFRWIFVVAAVLCVPYQLLMGLLAAFGYETVSWGGYPVTGFFGLLLAPLQGVFAAVLIALCLGTSFVVARRVFSLGQTPIELPTSLAEPDAAAVPANPVAVPPPPASTSEHLTRSAGFDDAL
jgi:hypothetical protein